MKFNVTFSPKIEQAISYPLDTRRITCRSIQMRQGRTWCRVPLCQCTKCYCNGPRCFCCKSRWRNL